MTIPVLSQIRENSQKLGEKLKNMVSNTVAIIQFLCGLKFVEIVKKNL